MGARQFGRSTWRICWARRLSGLVILVAVTGLLSSHWGWPLYLELLSHFQRQYFGVCFGATVAIAGLRAWRSLLVSAFFTAILSAHILPWYWTPNFGEPSADSDLRVLVTNINHQNRQYERVAALIDAETPDIALFMEVDDAWVEQLSTLLEDLTFTAGTDRLADGRIVLYSRYPLKHVELIPAGTEAANKVTIWATADVYGQLVNVVGTHPRPPITPAYFQSRNVQLDQAAQLLAAIAPPKLLIGDLNTTMWSPYYRRLRRTAGLKNARQGKGLQPSWPVMDNSGPWLRWLGQLLAIPIDHGLVSDDLSVVDLRVGPPIGSDHRPVMVHLQL